jgi:DNA recombination protein RmuC
MDINVITIITVSVASALGIVYFVNRKLSQFKPPADPATLAWLKSVSASQQAIYEKLAESARSLGEVSEIGKSMHDLREFLAAPKLRGGLGEQVLRELLVQSLPRESFFLQHAFRSGVRVDAAVKTASGIIPIDSKFSLENFRRMAGAKTENEREQFQKQFQRDVKERIDEVAEKYILPGEGTVDFALMYVPSEAIYYEIVSGDLLDYAHNKRVLPVSPTTFYAFLRSVMFSLEGQRIAAEIKDIQRALRALHLETNKFGDLLSTLQTHVTNAYTTVNRATAQFVGLASKVEAAQGIRKVPGELQERAEKEQLARLS